MNEVTTAAASALQNAQAALAERSKLTSFGEDLKVQSAATAARSADASAERAHAGAQSVLDVASKKTFWLNVSEEADNKVRAAQREQARLQGAIGHLPAMLREADDKIIAAHKTLASAVDQLRAAAQREYHAELVKLAEHAAEVKKRGYALAAGGLQLGSVLDGIGVPSAIGGLGLVRGNYAELDGDEAVRLDQIWKDDPAAAALFEGQIEFTRGLLDTGNRVRRIEAERQGEAIAANRAARLHSFANPPVQQFGPREPAAAPELTFVPRSDTHTPPPPPIREAAIPLDVTGDDSAVMSRAEIGRSQDQAAASAGLGPVGRTGHPNDPRGPGDVSHLTAFRWGLAEAAETAAAKAAAGG